MLVNQGPLDYAQGSAQGFPLFYDRYFLPPLVLN
jgi:hypothetical protein